MAAANSTAAIKLTVSVYLGAFALAQLVVGPLSDRFGRRVPLIAGMSLFTLASFVCYLLHERLWSRIRWGLEP